MATLTNINLLPWREQRRNERNKRILFICVFAWVLTGILAFAVVKYWDGRIEYQQARNVYLKKEIKKLSKVIKEIETLKDKRNAIVERMEVIQSLQENRAQIVHLFDDVVRKLPSGVYLDSMNKSGLNLQLNGRAQSNGRVSALMRNLDSSDWFDNSSLKVVDLVDQQGVSISKFDIQVSEENKKSDDENAE
ncbi:MAG: PilN domain-containing protein [Arenicella sp.]